jgi:hypothetical protein
MSSWQLESHPFTAFHPTLVRAAAMSSQVLIALERILDKPPQALAAQYLCYKLFPESLWIFVHHCALLVALLWSLI